MDLNPEKIPCKKCICFAICKGQDINNLLIKCSKLKEYMSIDLTHFDYALDILNTANNLTLEGCRTYEL